MTPSIPLELKVGVFFLSSYMTISNSVLFDIYVMFTPAAPDPLLVWDLPCFVSLPLHHWPSMRS